MGQPRFTFCIPNLNKRKFLPACIESVLSQDYNNWRCVFVDGYSTDGSWEYMQQFASDSRFLLLRGRKEGMYADWNECLKYVETEYFYFLTSDDTCFAQLISSTTAALDLYPDVDVCHFQFALINETGDLLNKKDFLGDSDSIYTDVNQHAHLRSGTCEFFMHFVYRAIYTTITSLVFRRCVIDKLEGFRTSFGTFGDYDWTMRLGLFTDVLYIPQTLSTWRIYGEQATKTVSYSQYHEWSLAIATLNIKQITRKVDVELNVQNSLKKRLLANFYEGFASAMYHNIYSSSHINEILQSLCLLMRNYPFYIVRKILNRVTLNLLFSHPRNNDTAQKIINCYGLNWPPIKVYINSTSKQELIL
jgi:glycosyltransferase involved in cell wall biosynthesis